MVCRACSSVAVVESQRAPRLERFNYKEVEAATGGFAADRVVGRGSHGCVYRATLRGVKRAVKRGAPGGGPGAAAMDNELEVLSKIRHQRVVNLVGVCAEPEREKILVVELLPNGSLHDALHKWPQGPRGAGGAGDVGGHGTPGWPLRVRLALHAAQGLLALHSASPPVLHRDIKSANILLDSKWNAKIGDFGLALRGGMEEIGRKRTPPAGTLGYLDPEYESPGRLSPKIDVFSFGIMLLEILSGREAIDVNFHPSSIVDWAVPLIKRGKTRAVLDPRLPGLEDDAVARHLAALAARCVRSNGVNRPSMSAVVESLLQASVKLPLPKSVNKWFVQVAGSANARSAAGNGIRRSISIRVADVKSRTLLLDGRDVHHAEDEDAAHEMSIEPVQASKWKTAHAITIRKAGALQSFSPSSSTRQVLMEATSV